MQTQPALLFTTLTEHDRIAILRYLQEGLYNLPHFCKIIQDRETQAINQLRDLSTTQSFNPLDAKMKSVY